MSELSQQQVDVYERLIAGHRLVIESSKSLVGRANTVLAASSVIVGIVTAARFLPEGGAKGFSVEFVLLGVVCLCSVVMCVAAGLLWRGGYTMIPGSLDVDVLYGNHISQELDISYYNLLLDLCGTVADNQALSMRLGRYLDVMVCAFILQLFFLTLSIVWGSIASFF